MEANLNSISKVFGSKLVHTATEAARREHWFIQAREHRKRREDSAQQSQEDLADLAASVVLADAADIQAFEDKLDRYDAATIEALENNRLRFEEVHGLLVQSNERVQFMLDQAHTLEDGRRVFLTRDRTKAFDEYGAEVAPTTFDFDLIGEDAPAYEDYADELQLRNELLEQHDQLTEERDALFKYQERLDEARERMSDDQITEDELEALDDELDAIIPPTVQAIVSDVKSPARAPTDRNTSLVFQPNVGDPTFAVGLNVSR